MCIRDRLSTYVTPLDLFAVSNVCREAALICLKAMELSFVNARLYLLKAHVFYLIAWDFSAAADVVPGVKPVKSALPIYYFLGKYITPFGVVIVISIENWSLTWWS